MGSMVSGLLWIGIVVKNYSISNPTVCSEQESPAAVIKKQKKQPKNYVLIVVLRTECGFAIITIYKNC